MGAIPQFYDGTGAPLDVGVDPTAVAPAWFGHRARLTEWLTALPASAWAGPTRCGRWSVGELTRHLASVSQFEGFTLHQAHKGAPTRLLQGMDAQTTPSAAAELLGDLEPEVLLETLRAADERIATTVAGWSAGDWDRTAEAPPGHVPAWLSLAHMLFDSWVHEHDLLTPRGEVPVVKASEVTIVVAYAISLAGFVGGVATGSGATLDVRLTDCDLRVGLDATGARAVTRAGWAPDGAPVVEGTAGQVLDVATGRSDALGLTGDAEGRAVLGALAALMV